MPCQSYDNDWDSGSSERKIRELKKQADMLARIACKALTELEKNEVEDLLLLQDDEVRQWWQKHKEDDAREQARLAEAERKQRVKEDALAKLSSEERELLGLAPAKKRSRSSKSSKSTVVDDYGTIEWENDAEYDAEDDVLKDLVKQLNGGIIRTWKPTK